MATFNGPFTGYKQPFARERVTVGNTAVGLTADTYNNAAAAVDVRRKATGARILIESAAIRFTEEGTTPTSIAGAGSGADLGTTGAVGDIIYLDGVQAIEKFKAIRNTASNGTLEVVYFR